MQECVVKEGQDQPTTLEIDLREAITNGKNNLQVDLVDGEIGLCFMKMELVLKNCLAVPPEKIEKAELE